MPRRRNAQTANTIPPTPASALVDGGEGINVPTVADALAGSGNPKGSVTVSEIDKTGATVEITFGEARPSSSGGSYLVAHGQSKHGAMVISAMAYIPIPKADRGDIIG